MVNALNCRFIAVVTAVALMIAGEKAEAHRLDVADGDALTHAIAAASPGDEIVLASGTYRLGRLPCEAAGTRDMPIIVRAEPALAANIEFDAVEGFVVSGPHWRFEGLSIIGVCAEDSTCEHAFHVVGAADGFVMRDNRVFDFNAHLKVNSAPGSGLMRDSPDDGLVEGNEFGNTHPRNTSNPVIPLNIDNGSRWVVRMNYIHDFHQSQGNQVSYGVYVKGGGQDPVFERNLILCERNVKPVSVGTTIGMSFGGGGMAPAMCGPAFSPNVPCNPEVTGGIMRNNIIANCTDVGIYLNRARSTMVLHNTLIATSGIDVRFPGSTAEIHGNVLTGRIRARNGGTFTGKDNLPSIKLSRFRAWYIDPVNGDLRQRGSLGSLLNKGMPTPLVTDDYCGRARDSKPDWGALEHGIGDCRTTRP